MTVNEALNEDEIDGLIESQANDDSAWEKPVKIRRQEAAAKQQKHLTRQARIKRPTKK